MKLLCTIGIHDWDGCKCSRCGKLRDQDHDWTGCKCNRCQKTRGHWHEWTEDLSNCSRCGAPTGYSSSDFHDFPKVREIIDKVALHSKCIKGQGWSRMSGDWKSVDELAMSERPIDLSQLLTTADLQVAKQLGIDTDLLQYAAQAFCFHSFYQKVGQDSWCDEVSTIVGDDAVDKLCRKRSLLSSYVLYRVATAEPITVWLSGCEDSIEYRFDFAGRAERARKELKRRGFGDRDPLNIITASA